MLMHVMYDVVVGGVRCLLVFCIIWIISMKFGLLRFLAFFIPLCFVYCFVLDISVFVWKKIGCFVLCFATFLSKFHFFVPKQEEEREAGAEYHTDSNLNTLLSTVEFSFMGTTDRRQWKTSRQNFQVPSLLAHYLLTKLGTSAGGVWRVEQVSLQVVHIMEILPVVVEVVGVINRATLIGPPYVQGVGVHDYHMTLIHYGRGTQRCEWWFVARPCWKLLKESLQRDASVWGYC
jgi:hypothetical protein